MKENSISYKTAKQETERLICEIEEITITHRAYTAECLRRVLKENEELKFQNDHAGANETSIVMAFRPDLVDFSRVKEDESNLIGIAGRHPVKESSAEYGKRIKEYTIECIYAGLRSEYPQLFEE